MDYFKQETKLPILDLYTEYKKMINHHILWSGGQICINAVPGHTDSTSYGCGSLYYDWSNKTISDNGSIEPGVRHTILEEEHFTEIADVFVGTLFETVLTTLQENFNVGRVRLMKSKPQTCLTWHYDPSPRLHYPIQTSKGCLMVIEDEVFHLPINEWWHTNTLKHHTAFNGSTEERIHLVVSLLD
jgi:hypothetical protein|tara:strand:- start:4747 stop:5304 length:558 start_codon:yes stop_codon:yes gene_type:complete